MTKKLTKIKAALRHAIELSEPKGSAWVSVHSAMPAEGVLVLVWWLDSIYVMKLEPRISISKSWLTAYWCDRHGAAKAHPYNGRGKPSSKEISHWMPLPDAPSDQGDSSAVAD